MAVSENPAVKATLDSQQLNALLDKVLPFARTAEAVARRLAGKVRTLAVLGVVAAVWLIYACYLTFDLSWTALLPLGVTVLIAPLALLRVVAMLRSVIGLPQRIADTVNRVAGKANEYRELYNSRPQTIAAAKPTLRQLWSTGKSLLEAKGLTDEAKEIASLTGGALAIANPVFAIMLSVTAIVTVLIVMVAAVVAIAHLI
jgi:hypothetical protein